MIATEMFEQKYESPEINKKIRIYKKTKNKRIKNKLFRKLFFECMNEKSVIFLDDVVAMKADIYFSLIEDINRLEELKAQYEKEKSE